MILCEARVSWTVLVRAFSIFCVLNVVKDGSPCAPGCFFYGGEDPATGSAAGCAASWLVKYGLAKSDEQVVIHQGAEAGRPSEIFVRGKCEGEHVTDIRVGGYAVEILRGAVTL